MSEMRVLLGVDVSDVREVGRRIARGIYLPPDSPGDVADIVLAVITASPPGTVAVGRTAAQLHKLWLPTGAQTVEVAAVSADRASRTLARPRHSVITVHRWQMGHDDLTIVDGVPITSVNRTWRDLAAILPLADLVAAGDSALRAGASLEELAATCTRLRGRAGARRASIALPMLDARSRSHPESHLRVAITPGSAALRGQRRDRERARRMAGGARFIAGGSTDRTGVPGIGSC
jgi:hypothetical protein